jgi:hypothetical protein
MPAQIDTVHWKKELFAVLDETFERVEGIYLDKGTSLFETLATVTAAEASRPISAQCASIAAQVNHVRYYLDVLMGYMRQQPPQSVDWPASWQVPAVTEPEWDTLRQGLQESYQQVRALFESIEGWDGDDDIAGALAIVIHTAYHLGEIRQGLGVLRS